MLMQINEAKTATGIDCQGLITLQQMLTAMVLAIEPLTNGKRDQRFR